MVEVFKTSVIDQLTAQQLVEQLHQSFSSYQANFDLEDRDNILRVESKSGRIDPQAIISLLEQQGFNAEVLPDELLLFPAK